MDTKKPLKCLSKEFRPEQGQKAIDLFEILIQFSNQQKIDCEDLLIEPLLLDFQISLS